MKRIGAFIMAIAIMLLTTVFAVSLMPTTVYAVETDVWNGTTTQPTKTTTVDGVYYYEISSAEELAYIAQTGGDWLGYNYILANDIVLNNVELTYDADGNLTVDESILNEWTPINGFKGIFDGNNFSISGVYVNTTSSAGFFANCRGDVSNLTITNSYIKGGSNTGGICGSFNETGKDIKNCFFDGAVIGTSNVGGLIGSNHTTNISNCGNYGDVWGTGDYVCGIVGSFDAYGIDNCFNKGNITSTGNYVAGIAGYSDIYGISGCTNEGNIIGNNYAAGICGKIENASLSKCANTGNITGNNYVGGICGDSRYGYVESWTSSISNSYNTGVVKGEEYVGGITGYVNYANISNSYNIGNVTGTSSIGAVVGHSESIWGKGTVSNCYYLKTDAINITLNGFGNAPDSEGIADAKGLDFFCIKEDKTLNLSGHTYSATCDANCDNCGYEREVIHNFTNLKYDSESHWYECRCGKVDLESKVEHSGKEATCTNRSICSTCNVEYGELAEHQYDSKWVINKLEHWHACSCGEKTDTAEHIYGDDNICDVCGYEKPQIGITVGIVAGSTAIVGIGGFSLVWFVIKKKSWADFISIFKMFKK